MSAQLKPGDVVNGRRFVGWAVRFEFEDVREFRYLYPSGSYLVERYVFRKRGRAKALLHPGDTVVRVWRKPGPITAAALEMIGTHACVDEECATHKALADALRKAGWLR